MVEFGTNLTLNLITAWVIYFNPRQFYVNLALVKDGWPKKAPVNFRGLEAHVIVKAEIRLRSNSPPGG